jgi:hypothetical protein
MCVSSECACVYVCTCVCLCLCVYVKCVCVCTSGPFFSYHFNTENFCITIPVLLPQIPSSWKKEGQLLPSNQGC